MRMRKVLLIFICLFVIKAAAQPGYRGQRNLLTLGMRSGYGNLLWRGAVNVIPSVELEKVLSRKRSLTLFGLATANRLYTPEYWGYFSGPVNINNYSFEHGTYRVKPLTKLHYSMVGFGFELKRYVMNAGGLAPFGTYYAYGLNSQYWIPKNTVKVRLAEQMLDGSNPEYYYYTETGKLPKLQTINFTFTYGKKRFITDNVFIDYSLTYGITGLWTNIPSYDGYNYRNGAQSLDFMMSYHFLQLMNRTQRFQFNLKGGWLF